MFLASRKSRAIKFRVLRTSRCAVAELLKFCQLFTPVINITATEPVRIMKIGSAIKISTNEKPASREFNPRLRCIFWIGQYFMRFKVKARFQFN